MYECYLHIEGTIPLYELILPLGTGLLLLHSLNKCSEEGTDYSENADVKEGTGKPLPTVFRPKIPNPSE
jgi:hypothetical protein